MMKIIYIAIRFSFFLLLVSCDNNEVNEVVSSTQTDITPNDNCFPISEVVYKELDAYRNNNVLPKVEKGVTKPSYFMSFFEDNQDTNMMIGYQPYVLEIFPDYAVKNDIQQVPTNIGLVEVDSIPLIIYDVANALGTSMYDPKCLDGEIPKEFFIKPDSFLTHVGPLRLYKISDGNLDFLKEIQRMVLK